MKRLANVFITAVLFLGALSAWSLLLVATPAYGANNCAPGSGWSDWGYYCQNQQTTDKLAVVVHGGGFYAGDATDRHTKTLINTMLHFGYNVASINYILCDGSVVWPAPVSDPSDGIAARMNSAIEQISQEIFLPTEVVVIGNSAGSQGAALVLYSDDYPDSPGINKFIGIAGSYNPDAIGNDGQIVELCHYDPSVHFTYHGKSLVPALLIEGDSDQHDRYANDSEDDPYDPLEDIGHISWLSNNLDGYGIYSEFYWLSIPGSNCNHGCPMDKLAAELTQGTPEYENPEVLPLIENFLATPTGFSISGKVTSSSDGSPIKGVTVTLSGTASATTTTDNNGEYSFTGLDNGDYTVTPNKTGYTFTTTNLAVTVAGADVPSQDFTATASSYTIRGKVETSLGVGIQNVTMTLTGTASDMATTDVYGRYSFKVVAGTYTVTPSMSGFTFIPASQSGTVNSNKRVDFIGIKN